LLGGHVGFESEEDRGSVFWIDVPISSMQVGDGEKVETPMKKSEKEQARSDAGPAHTVLYVEDNPDNMHLMEAIIGQFTNMKLLTAYNAELGFDLAISERPDLILMDINLPGINGIAAMKQLRDTAETKDTPVIAITAAAMPKDVEAGLQAGFRHYITKPINVPEFVRMIKETLDSVSSSA